MASWSETDRAHDLGELLDIPSSTYEGREGPALKIMSRLAGLQFIKDHDKRRAAGNEILTYANRVFPMKDPDSAPFYRKVQETVATQQELPNFTNELSYPNDKLISRYQDTGTIVNGLNAAGIGSGTTVATDAQKGAAKGYEKSAGSLAEKGMNTARGAGSQVAEGMGDYLVGPIKKGPFIMAWGIGETMYPGVMDYRHKLDVEIHRRYKDGRMTLDEYKKAFGENPTGPQYKDLK